MRLHAIRSDGVENEGQALLKRLSPQQAFVQLKAATGFSGVVTALELDARKFLYVLQNTDSKMYYHSFTIPKRRGGVRPIDRPLRGLSLAQENLASVLTANYSPKEFVKGYVKGQSFLTNAQYHEKQKWVLNIDIEDFFGSITFPRVFGLFRSSHFGFSPKVATILARIVTHNGYLPQGSPTSPVISNLVAYSLDKYLIAIARREKLRFSRYADDITLSSSQKTPPFSVVRSYEPAKGDRVVELGADIHSAFDSSNFRINHQKTRIQFSSERQEVTGLIVNKKANVWRADVARLRMKLHSAKKFGVHEAAKLWIGPIAKPEDFWMYIEGYLSFIRQVRGNDDLVIAKLCKLAVGSGFVGSAWIMRSAEMVREYDVFLSHASEDKDKVRLLYDRLKEIGVTAFFDVESIGWGDSIVQKINHGLTMSHFFVPFLSQKFADKGWTNKELNAAISLNISRKSRILPIRDTGFSVPDNYPLLADILYKDWPDDDAEEQINRLGDALQERVEREKMNSHDLG